MLTGNISCAQGHSTHTEQHCIGGERGTLESHLSDLGCQRNKLSTGNIFSANSLMATCSLKIPHTSSIMKANHRHMYIESIHWNTTHAICYDASRNMSDVVAVHLGGPVAGSLWAGVQQSKCLNQIGVIRNSWACEVRCATNLAPSTASS